MGTSKQNRKYKIKEQEETPAQLEFRILINNSYYLNGTYDSWESAELFAEQYVAGRRMSYVVTSGVSNAKPVNSNQVIKKVNR